MQDFSSFFFPQILNSHFLFPYICSQKKHMTTTLIILVITVALFIWGRVRADIVALTALAGYR